MGTLHCHTHFSSGNGLRDAQSGTIVSVFLPGPLLRKSNHAKSVRHKRYPGTRLTSHVTRVQRYSTLLHRQILPLWTDPHYGKDGRALQLPPLLRRRPMGSLARFLRPENTS
jgi:hypothetical protein